METKLLELSNLKILPSLLFIIPFLEFFFVQFLTQMMTRFQTIIADIENLTRGGTIAEVFPKLLVLRNVMEKILTMGMINDYDFQVALKCTGKASPLRIARDLGKTRNSVNEALKRLEQLDIIKL